MEPGPYRNMISRFKVDIDGVFSSVEEVNVALPISDLSCPVCLAVTTNPRLTMCGHRICLDCATRLVTTTTTTTMKCPTCAHVDSAKTIPDHRTRDTVMSQTVVCGHKGCSEECKLCDVLGHMKRCKFRADEPSVLEGAVKRCRDEIEILDEDTERKKMRYSDVNRVVTNYNDAMARKGDEGEIPIDRNVEQVVYQFMQGLRQAIGDKRFQRLYRDECTSYHQSLVDKVKVATTSA